MKARVTKVDLELGRELLTLCRPGDTAAFEALCTWQAEHFGVSDDVWRKTMERVIGAGDTERARKLFEAVAAPIERDEWHNLRSAIVKGAAGLFGVLLTVLVLGALIGGFMYAVRACGGSHP